MQRGTGRGGLMTAVGLVLLTTPVVSWARQADSQALDEIIVTARKRSETLVEVPSAISAITAEERRNLVLDGMKDYLRQAPSATLVTSGPEYLQDISIRGQGSGRLGFSEAATGLYKDGLYNAGGGFGGRSLSRMDLLDIERLEVLRGPQGALYGRNSVGGAVNVVGRAPDQTLSGALTARYSQPERGSIEGVVNLPLAADKLALRVAGLYDDQNSGFIKSQTTGHDLDWQTYKGLRAGLRWTPDSATTVDLTYERYESDTPAFSSLARRAVRVDGSVLDASRWTRADLDREGRAKITEDSVYLSAKSELGFADLTAKVGWKTRDAGRTNEDNDHYAGHSGIDVAPGAAVLTPDYTVGQFEDYSRFVAQAYLSSKGEGRLTWLAGVEFLSTSDDVVIDPYLCPAYSGAVQPIAAGCVVGQAGALTGTSASVRSSARLSVNHDAFSESLKSPSLFGSLEYKITDATTLGVEARLQRDKKSFWFERYAKDPLAFFGAGATPTGLMAVVTVDPDGATGPLPASSVEFCPPDVTGAACAPGNETARVEAERRWTFVTPTVTLRHRFDNGANVYGRFATGYRPGGFNSNLPPTTVRSQIAQQLLYDPEYAYSYEAGAKGRWKGVQLSAAIYYTWTNNVQVVSAPSSLSRGFILQNAGDAHVAGYEIEARRRFLLGAADLTISASLSGQKGKFEDGAKAKLDLNGDGLPDDADLGGKAVPRLRDYQFALNATYSFPLGGAWRGFASAGLQMADGGYENPDNSRSYQGYGLIDARLGVRSERVRLSVFGRNLGDKTYLANIVSANEFYTDPRVIGVELGWEF